MKIIGSILTAVAIALMFSGFPLYISGGLLAGGLYFLTLKKKTWLERKYSQPIKINGTKKEVQEFQDNIIDATCLKHILDWKQGKITEDEARKRVSEHEDELLFETLNNGFSTHYFDNPNQ